MPEPRKDSPGQMVVNRRHVRVGDDERPPRRDPEIVGDVECRDSCAARAFTVEPPHVKGTIESALDLYPLPVVSRPGDRFDHELVDGKVAGTERLGA